MRCPRRDEYPATSVEHRQRDDLWRGEYRRRYCSFCGSMPPEDFLAAVKAGQRPRATHRDYKTCIGRETLYYCHMSPLQQRELVDLINLLPQLAAQLGPVLPYFVGSEIDERQPAHE